MEGNKKRRVDEEPMETDENVPEGQNGEINDENMDSSDVDHISDDEEGGIRIGDIYIPPAPKPALTFDANGPRLIIDKIVITNFKSYAGVQTLGPFHKSFTAIIGPNGSGKSNVIDAILFVFGYSGTMIRSKKQSVIHSSAKFPNEDYATVAVHFIQIIDEEDENYSKVPNSDLVVSKTTYKNGQSVYTLNDRRVRFKEVATMLRSHGIDLGNKRFLILQGEVEQISLMPPKSQKDNDTGLLEYLEDIIGTSRYKEPLHKLDNKLDEYNELRRDKLDRVKTVEEEKLRLEQPMKEAVELINLINTAQRTKNMLLQKKIHETTKTAEVQQAELEKLQENLAQIDEKLQEINNELQEKNDTLRNAMEHYTDKQKKKERTKEKLQACKKKLATVQAEATQATKKKKNLEELLSSERGKLIDYETIPEKNNQEINECEVLLERHRENKRHAEEELKTVMAGVRSETQGLQETKDRLQKQLLDQKKIVNEANNKYKLTESKLKLYLSTEVKEKEKLQELRDTYENSVKDIEEKKGIFKSLSSSIPTAEAQLKDTIKKIQTLKKDEESTLREIRSLRAQLEQSRQAMSANRSRGRVLDSLMREKASGALPGIFGRLGDLGGIPSKYDVAISTCCGALDNIVVDTVETAQSCVEHLKRTDIGRATFIVLDKQQNRNHRYRRQNNYPENVPRLFDLINVNDERVLPAFYFALRDTLVANDLEQATRIAYGVNRYRVATLGGDVIEIAGTMSGGGRTVMRGRMSSSVQQDTSDQDPREIQQNENRLQNLEERLSDIRNEQSNLDNSLISLERSVKEDKIQLSKLKIELDNFKMQVPVLKKRIQEQERKTEASTVDANEKERLEDALAEVKTRWEKAQSDAEKVESKVRKVDSQIGSIAGGKVKELQTIVDDLTNKINKISAEVSKLKVAITTSQRNAKKAKDNITQMEADLKETEENLERLKNRKNELVVENEQLQKKFEELEEQLNEESSEFADLKKEIGKLQSQENKVKSERLEANNAVSEKEKSMHEFTSKISMWKRELSNIKLEDPGLDGIPGIERPEPLKSYTPEELEECSVSELKNRLTAQIARVGDTKPNIRAIQDYKAKEALYLKREAELSEITTKRNEIRALFEQLVKRRNTDFKFGFNIITNKLKEMYQMITLGGDAELEFVDSMDPFTEGITFSVRPPNKSWKNILNLSGGEKTLSSLALVFALHYYKPSPLYVMDEIDAALDFKNVSIVANYIKERTKNSQFIIISLRSNMFDISRRLLGIYKTEDCTKSVAINNTIPSAQTV